MIITSKSANNSFAGNSNNKIPSNTTRPLLNKDCLYNIALYISDGTVYKNWIFSGRMFRDVIRNHIEKVREFSDHMQTLYVKSDTFRQYILSGQGNYKIVCNPGSIISRDLELAGINLWWKLKTKEDWFVNLMRNAPEPRSVPIYILDDYIGYALTDNEISENEVECLMNKYGRSSLLETIRSLGLTGMVHHSILRKLRVCPIYGADVTFEIYLNYLESDKEFMSKYSSAYLKQYILVYIVTEEDILAYPTYEWNYHHLSNNFNISLDFIIKTCDKPWEWRSLSSRITDEVYLLLPDKPWNTTILSAHLTPELIPFELNYVEVSANEKLTIDFIRKHKDKLDWYNVTINPAFTWEDVINNPDLPWVYEAYSYNPNITWDIVINNSTIKFDHHGLIRSFVKIKKRKAI